MHFRCTDRNGIFDVPVGMILLMMAKVSVFLVSLVGILTELHQTFLLHVFAS